MPQLGLGYNGHMKFAQRRLIQTQSARGMISRSLIVVITAVVLGIWLLYTPSGLMGKADAIGYAVCHRIDVRSFHLAERQLPLCARCSGMYLGALASLIAFSVFRPKAGRYPKRSIQWTLVLFVVIWAIDGINSYLHLFPDAPHAYPASNVLRLVTGTLLGISLATLVYPAFNQFAWQDWADQPVLRSFRELGWILLLAAVIVLLILSGNPIILYPLALLSSLSVIILLCAVYSTVVLTVLRKEGQANAWRDLTLPLLIGLTLAVGQIAIIDLGRFWLTGTWEGFRF